jgi:hypothetical protein
MTGFAGWQSVSVVGQCLRPTDCVTGGGELPARNVIHAVGVRAEECSDADSMYSDTMKTVFNALDTTQCYWG